MIEIREVDEQYFYDNYLNGKNGEMRELVDSICYPTEGFYGEPIMFSGVTRCNKGHFEFSFTIIDLIRVDTSVETFYSPTLGVYVQDSDGFEVLFSPNRARWDEEKKRYCMVKKTTHPQFNYTYLAVSVKELSESVWRDVWIAVREYKENRDGR